MPRYRLTVEIDTEQDPSALLEVLEQFACDLPENCFPEGGLVVDGSVTVEEIAR
jgi:hypothetical protein